MKKMSVIIAFVLAVLSAVSCSHGENKTTELPVNEPRFTEDGKPIVTVGTMGYQDPLFTDQNNKPKNMEIEIINYSKGIDIDDYSDYKEMDDAIRRKLDNELISGNAPDILCVPPDDMLDLINKGILCDLYELMDECDQLKREDFLPCVLEGMTIDGKLPAIMDAYYLRTAVAKTKFIPKEYENWTADDAMMFYEKYSGQMDFCEPLEETSLADYMLMNEGMNSIDLRNSRCDLSGAFTKMLDFCKVNPIPYPKNIDFSKLTDNEINAYFNDLNTRGLNDTQLVFPLIINGFNSDLGQSTYGYFNTEDVTFVGYPSENGRGAYAMPANFVLFGISSQSANKEAAWELLCLMLKHQKKLEKYMSDGTRGIPVLMEQIERDYDRPADYSNSINNGHAIPSSENYGETYITQEYKDMLYDYILSVPADLYRPTALENMIDEEIQPVILDNRTTEAAVDILQKRIETYLSERE